MSNPRETRVGAGSSFRILLATLALAVFSLIGRSAHADAGVGGGADASAGPGVFIFPSSVTLGPGVMQTFTASGGTPPYAWSLTGNGSGPMAALGAMTGMYVSGALAGVDIVTVTDAKNKTADATVTVVVKPVPLGTVCMTADDCATGSTGSRNCVDGYCCDTACSGQCQACNAGGHLGTCITIAGPPVGMRPPCAQSDPNNICSTKACDGTTATSCTIFVGSLNTPGSQTQCQVPTCVDGVGTSGSFCESDGGCQIVTPKSCGDYACVGGGCATSCTDTSECSGGNYCNVTTGKCVKPDAAPPMLDGSISTRTTPATSSGCTIGRATRSARPFLVLTALLGALVVYRRKRRG